MPSRVQYTKYSLLCLFDFLYLISPHPLTLFFSRVFKIGGFAPDSHVLEYCAVSFFDVFLIFSLWLMGEGSAFIIVNSINTENGSPMNISIRFFIKISQLWINNYFNLFITSVTTPINCHS